MLTLTLLSTFSLLGADVGAVGTAFLPRGPFPSSARLLKALTASGTAFRFTTGDDASLDLACDKSESFRSLACFETLPPISSLRSDLGGGGGGRSSTAETDEGMD